MSGTEPVHRVLGAQATPRRCGPTAAAKHGDRGRRHGVPGARGPRLVVDHPREPRSPATSEPKRRDARAEALVPCRPGLQERGVAGLEERRAHRSPDSSIDVSSCPETVARSGPPQCRVTLDLRGREHPRRRSASPAPTAPATTRLDAGTLIHT